MCHTLTRATMKHSKGSQNHSKSCSFHKYKLHNWIKRFCSFLSYLSELSLKFHFWQKMARFHSNYLLPLLKRTFSTFFQLFFSTFNFFQCLIWFICLIFILDWFIFLFTEYFHILDNLNRINLEKTIKIQAVSFESNT